MSSLDDGQPTPRHRDEIPLLVFEHIDCRLGIDVDQVETLTSLPRAPAAGQEVTCEYEGHTRVARSLGAWLGLDDAGWQPSRLLITRAGDEVHAFLVDMPRAIITLPLEAIHPLPVLVKRSLGPSPFWAVGRERQNDALILLVDLGAPGAAPGAKTTPSQVEE